MITGCRRGEIVGLKWPKVNWEDSSITIDCALTYTPDRGVYESTTKTEDVRIIKLPKETMDLLRDYRRWQLEMRLAMGDRWHASEYVLTSEKGGPMSPDTLSSFLRKFERRHHLPHIHAHNSATPWHPFCTILAPTRSVSPNALATPRSPPPRICTPISSARQIHRAQNASRTLFSGTKMSNRPASSFKLITHDYGRCLHE